MIWNKDSSLLLQIKMADHDFQKMFRLCLTQE